jgi:hypothetical protein
MGSYQAAHPVSSSRTKIINCCRNEVGGITRLSRLEPKFDMKTETKDTLDQRHWCECECTMCDLGAHERCADVQCHHPKWDEITQKA